jgi:Replication-relaxation
MGKKAASRVKLTDRDRNLLALVGQRGCVTIDMMHRNFWTSAKIRTCQERIDLLEKAGYLKSELVEARGRPETIYYLDKKGKGQFDGETRKTFYKKRPSMTEISHALEMSDVLDSFSSKVTSFTNEHQLKSLNAVLNIPLEEVADGEVTLQDGEGNERSFYVEIDSKNYNGARLARKLEQLASLGSSVIMVSRSNIRVQRLQAFSQAYQNIQFVHFNDLNSI